MFEYVYEVKNSLKFLNFYLGMNFNSENKVYKLMNQTSNLNHFRADCHKADVDLNQMRTVVQHRTQAFEVFYTQ